MEQSEAINELAVALNSVQQEDLFALTDKSNPFFKSKYADLSSVWSVGRKPLTKNGLSVVQTMDQGNDGNPVIVTTLLHNSGQWIRGRLEMPSPKKDPQGFGAAITYARRYSLAAILGICPEDDDAESAMKSARKTPKEYKPKAGPGGATKPQFGKLYALGFQMWPGHPEKEVKERVKGIAAWYRKGDAISKAEASELIENWDAAVENYMEQKGSTPQDYGKGHDDAISPPLEDAF